VAWMRKDKPPPTRADRVWKWLNTFSFYVYTVLVVFLLLLGVLWKRVFITVPPGHHGVMFRQLGEGTVTDKVWGEGLHVIPPWDRLTLYESRLQQQKIRIDILSDEGLTLGINVSIRFRPNHCLLGFLHQDIGPEYYDRLIRPDVEAHVRQTLGNRPAHEIYASAKDVVQELGQVPMITRVGGGRDAEGNILAPTSPPDVDESVPLRERCTDKERREGYIELQELKLIDVDLPEIVVTAIAEKYRQEQLMLEYRHRLTREEQEAERKRIEAKGIRDYNAIAGEVSEDLLRWRDVEATTELAKSPSSKVIVLGGGGGGQTPLLFNLGSDATPAPAPAPAPAPSNDEAPTP